MKNKSWFSFFISSVMILSGCDSERYTKIKLEKANDVLMSNGEYCARSDRVYEVSLVIPFYSKEEKESVISNLKRSMENEAGTNGKVAILMISDSAGVTVLNRDFVSFQESGHSAKEVFFLIDRIYMRQGCHKVALSMKKFDVPNIEISNVVISARAKTN